MLQFLHYEDQCTYMLTVKVWEPLTSHSLATAPMDQQNGNQSITENHPASQSRQFITKPVA